MKIKKRNLVITNLFFCMVILGNFCKSKQLYGSDCKSNNIAKHESFEAVRFRLRGTSIPLSAPLESGFTRVKSKYAARGTFLDSVIKLSGLQSCNFEENCIKNAFNLYKKYGVSIKKIFPDKADSVKHKNFSEIKKLLSERAKRGKPGKLNILMIKIELGGGHKAAIQAMSDSLLEGLSAEDKKLINIIPIDFFGPDKDHAARDFNKMLENEDADALARNLGGKPLLEKFYDTLPGLLQIKRNIDSEIKKFADSIGVSPEQLCPDIVISAQPFGLHALSKYVTSIYNTQLRIVPTDFYLGDWMQRFQPLQQFDPTVRYDASYDAEYIRSQFEEKGIHAVSFFGYPIRKDISEMADKLYDDDLSVRKKARGFVNKIIKSLSQNPTVGNKGFKRGDQTALIMMGSKGTGAQRYISYLRSMFEYAKGLNMDQVVHVYVAALKPRSPKGEELVNHSPAQIKYSQYFEKQQEIFEEVQTEVIRLGQKADSRIKVHLLSFLNAKQVGSLIYHGVTITKAGGSTAAEIASLGGRALFNMRISKVAPWERGNVDFLESSGRAIRMSTEIGLESAFVIEGMKDLVRRGRRGPVEKNPFQKTWGSTVLRDLKDILHYKSLDAGEKQMIAISKIND